MSAPYTPVNISLGVLPECHGEMKSYDLSANGQLPTGVKEILVYAFVTTRGEGDFQRGYYEIYTSHEGKEYKQYMNVATGQGVKAVNSANLWIPFAGGTLYIKLVHSEGKESIAHKTSEDQKDWSEVFIIGFKV